jgi:outer membrane receptor protein involved in Fe transport
MNKYRPAAVALAACAASLSLAACSAGITTASTATTAATSSSSPSRSTTASPAPAGRMLAVEGDVHSFPVPADAKVAQNIGVGGQIIIIFGTVTPAKVSSFYRQALPKAGYTVSTDSVISQGGNTVVLIQFTGHGIKGNIDGLATYNQSTADLPGLGHKNVTTISLQSK